MDTDPTLVCGVGNRDEDTYCVLLGSIGRGDDKIGIPVVDDLYSRLADRHAIARDREIQLVHVMRVCGSGTQKQERETTCYFPQHVSLPRAVQDWDATQ